MIRSPFFTLDPCLLAVACSLSLRPVPDDCLLTGVSLGGTLPTAGIPSHAPYHDALHACPQRADDFDYFVSH